MKILTWLKGMKRETVVKNSFLIPILLVVIMSISHVVSWYDIGNPLSWAIYLSVAIEVFALASVSAASMKINRSSVWFLFGLVTSIQIIGNIFFEFNDIDENSSIFKSWVSLVQPLFEDWTAIDHRRLLAAIHGGTLPLMSLTALHYYIKFNDSQQAGAVVIEPTPIEPTPVTDPEPEPEVTPIEHEEVVSSEPTATTEPIVENIVKEEKKADSDQIHITKETNDGSKRKRLHPSKYS